MRRIIVFALAGTIAGYVAAWAQNPQQPTCEDRLKVLQNYIQTLTAARDNAEIQLAVERQKSMDIAEKLAATEAAKREVKK